MIRTTAKIPTADSTSGARTVDACAHVAANTSSSVPATTQRALSALVTRRFSRT